MCIMSPCGLDCTPCPLRTAQSDIKAAQSILEWYKSEGWIDKNAEVEELLKKAPFCCGCRGDRTKHWSADCSILICCVDKNGHDNCSECDDFPCNKLKEWADNGQQYKEALDRLLTMKGAS